VSYGFGLTIESLVAILLLLTILYCARLNKQIIALKANEQAMKTSVAEVVTATENAERAIAGLRVTLREAEETLSPKLQAAQAFSTAMTEHLKAGEDVLVRLRKIAYANNLLASAEAETSVEAEPAPAPAPVRPAPSDTRSIAAAAAALAERARQRAHGRAA
jgi:hypothetical protein